jgi:hypothetical protein
MKIHSLAIIVCLFLVLTSPLSGEEPPTPSLPDKNSSELKINQTEFTQESSRIRNKLNLIAETLQALSARMRQTNEQHSANGISALIKNVIALQQKSNPADFINEFLSSSDNALRWDACLKAGKFYLSVLDEIFGMSGSNKPANPAIPLPASLIEETPEILQVLFLTRIAAEYEIREAGLHISLMAQPKVGQLKQWQMLFLAFQKDDRSNLKKMNLEVTKAGIPPRLFAAKLISPVRDANPEAAAMIVEGMGIVDPAGSIWKPQEIPEMNPDFIRVLACDREAMGEFTNSDFSNLFPRFVLCRGKGNPSFPEAFAHHVTAKSIDEVKTNPPADFAPSTGQPQLRLPQNDLPWETPRYEVKIDKNKTNQTPDQNSVGTHNIVIAAPPIDNIPVGWIRCECPDDHPNAGRLINGIRWHAPVLTCPNPDIKRWEVK